MFIDKVWGICQIYTLVSSYKYEHFNFSWKMDIGTKMPLQPKDM